MLSDFVKYVKQYWHDRPDKSTPLNADRLNHIENGIGSNSEAINQIANAVVSNIVNDPDKIASMAAVYALQEKLGTGELPSDAPNAISAINTLYSNLKGFNFYYFKAWSHAHIVSDILDDTAFCILGENYYSTVTKVEGQMYISNVVGNGDITFDNNVVTINIADKFGIIISNKEITIK